MYVFVVVLGDSLPALLAFLIGFNDLNCYLLCVVCCCLLLADGGGCGQTANSQPDTPQLALCQHTHDRYFEANCRSTEVYHLFNRYLSFYDDGSQSRDRFSQNYRWAASYALS